MPRLVSPPVVRTQPCASGAKKAQGPGHSFTSRKRKTHVDSDDFFIKGRSPSKSPLREPLRKTNSPSKKRPSLRTPDNSNGQKGVVRNFRPMGLTTPGDRNLDEVCRALVQDAKSILENGDVKMTAEETFHMVEELRSRSRAGGENFGKALLKDLENVVVEHLTQKISVRMVQYSVTGTTEFFTAEWTIFSKNSALLRSLFSSLDSGSPTVKSSQSPIPSSPGRISVKDMLDGAFGSQLGLAKDAIFSDISLRLNGLRDVNSLVIPRDILAVREMLTQTNCQMYRDLCTAHLASIESDYSVRIHGCDFAAPLEFLNFTQKIITYEQEVARSVLSESLAEEIRLVLTELSAKHFSKISSSLTNLWQCSWEIFSKFAELSKNFLNDRNLSPILLAFFRMFWSGQMKPLLDPGEIPDTVPARLLACMASFESWAEDLSGISGKVRDSVMFMLSEAVRQHLPEAAAVQALVGAFAQLVALHAWDEKISVDLKEVGFVVEYLKLFKEIDAFESSLRSVTANYFVQNKPPTDFQTPYITQLQSSLTACFSVDWTAFQSVLVELSLSHAFSTQFHESRSTDTSTSGKNEILRVSLLNSATVAQCFTPIPLNLPQEIAGVLEDFHLFYTQQTRKKLTFLSGLGSCTLIGRDLGALPATVTITTTLPQATILLAFNDISEISLAELKFQTGLPEGSLLNELKMLEDLLEVCSVSGSSQGDGCLDSVLYRVNPSGLVKSRRMNFLMGFKRRDNSVKVSAKKREVNASLLERKHRMDAVIVSVMKVRKSLSFADLLKEVQSKLTALQPSDMENRIAGLVDREFLSWKDQDKTVLDYIP